MQSTLSPSSTRAPLAPAEVAALAMQCRARGDDAVAAAVGLDRLTIARAALGLKINRGNREMISRYLAGEVQR